MDTASDNALDRFAGLCAIGTLADIEVEPLQTGPLLSAVVTGTVWFQKRRYDMEAWAGLRTGPPSTIMEENSLWLNINGETLDLGSAEAARIGELVHDESLQDIAAAIDQITALLDASLKVFSFVRTEWDLDKALDGLSLAADTKIVVEHELDAVVAEMEFTTNCCNTLLRQVAVSESADVHLGFDVAAVTLDPGAGAESEIGVGWIDPGDGFVHAIRIGTRSCQAHDDADVAELMTPLSEESKGHFLHAFNHLHQVSDAVGRYAVAKAAVAIATASTVENPLLAQARHQRTHDAYAMAAKRLNDLALELSGQAGR